MNDLLPVRMALNARKLLRMADRAPHSYIQPGDPAYERSPGQRRGPRNGRDGRDWVKEELWKLWC